VKEMIKRFCETFGPSGYEDKVRQVILDEVTKYADSVTVDPLGNLIALKKGDGTGKKVMMAGHIDEIGVIVTFIDDNGFLRFANVGGVSPAVALGQRVLFENGTTGIIGQEKIDDPKDLKLERLFIDIGASTKAEAQQKVSVGDMAGFYAPVVDLGKRMYGKSMDDRIGCVVMAETMKRMKRSANDCYFVFTVQEEVGLRGAKTAAYAISPDMGIALDVTRTGDTPKCAPMAIELGKGVAIKVKDASIICHPAVKRLMVETAKKNGIPYQMEVLEAGGTDSGSIHLTKEGVPSGVISIPTRYVHMPVEMIDMGDLEACVSLLVKMLESKIEI
jgi:tetrahedral aminopeptidase